MRQHAADLLTNASTRSLRLLLHSAWAVPAVLLAVGLFGRSSGVVVLALGLAAGTSLSGSI